MYVIAIGWLYVVVMIAAVSDTLLKGIIRLLFLGVLPVGLLLWIKLARYRAREVERAEAAAATSDTQDVRRTPE
jgi:type VI protein secretion system component VasK